MTNHQNPPKRPLRRQACENAPGTLPGVTAAKRMPSDKRAKEPNRSDDQSPALVPAPRELEPSTPIVDKADDQVHGHPIDPASLLADWWRRQSVRQLRARAKMFEQAGRGMSDDSFDGPLPPNEAVHLGGLVLVEAFTPSSASSLRKALAKFDAETPASGNSNIILERSRTSAGIGGLQNLGYVRPPGEFVLPFGRTDEDIPDGVAAIWLKALYPSPSLSLVVATFIIGDHEGDLTDFFSGEGDLTSDAVGLHVKGRFGRIRQAIPWARPKSFFYTGQQFIDQRREHSIRKYVETYETACCSWLSKRFPGHYQDAVSTNRPIANIFFTATQEPYHRASRSLNPVGLWQGKPWESTASTGWRCVDASFQSNSRRIHFAARRSDIANSSESDPSQSLSNWSLGAGFHESHTQHVVLWTIACLLKDYISSLARLRDRAGRGRFGRPVRQSVDLERYLSTVGLDAATVAPEMKEFVEHSALHLLGGVDYESRARQPVGDDEHSSQLLSESSRRGIAFLANRVGQLSDWTTSTINVSAELKNSIANTRLQRAVLLLSVVATVIALVGLLKS